MITPLDVCKRILVLTPAVSGPPRRVVWWAATSLTWKTSRTASHQSPQILKEKCKKNGKKLPSDQVREGHVCTCNVIDLCLTTDSVWTLANEALSQIFRLRCNVEIKSKLFLQT